jgi:hypothetical protein
MDIHWLKTKEKQSPRIVSISKFLLSYLLHVSKISYVLIILSSPILLMNILMEED